VLNKEKTIRNRIPGPIYICLVLGTSTKVEMVVQFPTKAPAPIVSASPTPITNGHPPALKDTNVARPFLAVGALPIQNIRALSAVVTALPLQTSHRVLEGLHVEAQNAIACQRNRDTRFH
jgi:hypothetical protein